MKPIQDYIGQEMRWVHPRLFSRLYELHVGDEVIATISWKGGFSNKAVAQMAEQEWEFRRTGTFHTAMSAFLPGEETAIATFKRGMSGGTLEFPDGRQYKWKNTSFWKGIWSWLTTEQMPLLQLSRRQLTIEDVAVGLQELSLLVMFGFYLIKTSEEEAATTAAVVSIT